MKITVKASEPKDSKLEAKVTIAAEDVDAAIKQAYKDIANKYRFQGFRKGKAPRPVIDGLVGRDYVLSEASESLLNDATPLVLDKLDVVPLGQISYGDEPVVCKEGEAYKLTATITLRPDAELESYDAPEINLPPKETTEAEIDEQLDTLLSYQASYEDVDAKTYQAAPGDMLTIDVENVEGGEHLAGTDRPFMIGASVAPEEFSLGVTGMKIDETKEVSYTEAGTTVTVKVTLKSAKKRVVPELTDELASKSFGYDDVAALREAVKDEVAEDKQAQLPSLKETRVIEALAAKLKLDEVPEAYRKEIFDEIAQDFLAQLQRQGLTLDAWLSARHIQAGEFIDDLNVQAIERARQSLALDALAKHLELTVSEKDIEDEFKKAGADDVEATIKEFKDAGRLPAVRETIKRSKAVDWLLENAKVNEVDEIAERRTKRAEAIKSATKKSAAKKTAAKKTTKKSEDEADKKPAAKKSAAKKPAAKKTTKKDAE